jgi:hypothetical protein
VPVRVFRKAWPAVRACFDETGGLYHNPRLEREREKQDNYREKMSANGKKGGRPPKATALIPESHGFNSGKPFKSIPLPLPLPTNSLTTSADAEEIVRGFDLAWASYPKRAGGNNRKDALKAWTARCKAGVDTDLMHDGTVRYAAFCIATGNVGTKYVMQGATFYGPSERYADDWEIPKAETVGALDESAVLRALGLVA